MNIIKKCAKGACANKRLYQKDTMVGILGYTTILEKFAKGCYEN